MFQHVAVADNASFSTSLLTTTGNGVTWNASTITQQSLLPTFQLIYGAASATPYERSRTPEGARG